MRAIITGDRNFRDYSWLNKKCLDVFTQLKNEGYSTDRDALEIVTTRAKGPEKLAILFAANHNLRAKVINTVNSGGINAAYEKNDLMVDYVSQDPELGVLIAFWNNTGIVVNDLVNKCLAKNIKVFEIRVQ